MNEYSPSSMHEHPWSRSQVEFLLEGAKVAEQTECLIERARDLDKNFGTIQIQPQWRQGMMYNIRQAVVNAAALKAKFLNSQRQASLLVEVNELQQDVVLSFAQLFRLLVKTPMPPELHGEQLELLKLVIQDSIIIEWPRKIPGIDNTEVEVDFAPLIHRARTAVKCRTSQPTMRVRVCAITPPSEEAGLQSVIVEAFFRATLVKHTSDSSEHQVAGRLILTQREGTPATKSQDQNGATVNEDGRLIASQAAVPNGPLTLLNQYGEKGKTTQFKYEQGALCATFPQMGVTLNSMVDRRQLTTRYAIQVEVAINVDNKLLVKHTIYSHPFLIAITNDQTEPLLLSIFWQRLLNSDQLPETSFLQAETLTKPEPPVPWKVLKKALRNFVKAQYPPARSLYKDELFHIQCMLFLPRAISCGENLEKQVKLEKQLFNSVNNDGPLAGQFLRKIKYRLQRENVGDDVLVEKHEVMTNKCISLTDKETELGHTLWQWLYKNTEIIMDVGHKVCPTPATIEKKGGSKPKKPPTTAEDYPTMVKLFNDRIVTFSGLKDILKMFKTLKSELGMNRSPTMAIMIRFCDENAGYLSLAFTNRKEPAKPLVGVLSLEQIKEFKQGLPEALFDEPFPKKYDKIAYTELDRTSNPPKLTARLGRKNVIFSNYKTLRSQNEYIAIRNDDIIRINSLTGEELCTTDQSDAASGVHPSQSFSPQVVSHLLMQLQLLTSQSSNGVELPTAIETAIETAKRAPSSNASSTVGSTAGSTLSDSSNISFFSHLSDTSSTCLPNVRSPIDSPVMPTSQRPNELKGASKRKVSSWLNVAVSNKRAKAEQERFFSPLQSITEGTEESATMEEDEPLNLVVTKTKVMQITSPIFPTPTEEDYMSEPESVATCAERGASERNQSFALEPSASSIARNIEE